MNPLVISALVQQVLVPEIAAIIRAHANATNGQMPTDAQVIAALGSDTDRFINIGNAFLASKGVPPSA